MGELIVAAIKLDAAHGSDVVGRFECSHEIIRISRTTGVLIASATTWTMS